MSSIGEQLTRAVHELNGRRSDEVPQATSGEVRRYRSADWCFSAGSFEMAFERWPPLPSLICDGDVAEINGLAVGGRGDDALQRELRH